MAAGQWWIDREGTLGQIVSSLDPGQIANLSVQFHVVQHAGKPNASAMGPYPTRAAAQAAADAQNASQAGLGAAGKAVVQKVSNAVPGLSQIGTFFSDLGQASTWIRVGEVILGIILLGVGIAHITKADNVISKAVKTGSKAALLA
jgi:hypothetical protein